MWTYNPMHWLMSGYFSGKITAEKCVKEEFFGNGISIRPGVVIGTRYMLGGRVGLPLYLMNKLPPWLVSSAYADDVAQASVRFVQSQEVTTDDNVTNDNIKNFMLDVQGNNSKNE